MNFRILLGALAVAVLLLGISQSVDAAEISEDFSTDPGWDEFGNRDDDQDFGWSDTNNAGGTAGEIGGHIIRTPLAWYAQEITPIDVNTTSLHTSGTVILSGSGNFLMGWFDSTAAASGGLDWAPTNFLGFRSDDNSLYVFADGGGDSFASGVTSGASGPTTFDVTFDHTTGDITATSGQGLTQTRNIGSGGWSDLANLDRFGILTLYIDGNDSAGDIFVDDLTYTGEVGGGTGSLACDFTGPEWNPQPDSVCDVLDIDDLFGQGNLVTGVSAAGSVYDLTGDGMLNGDDVAAWLSNAATKNGQSSPYIPSDVDLDRDVDLTDFNTLAGNFNPIGSDAVFSVGDGDGNGSVNLSDYNTLAGSFNPIGYGGATAVPEPASLVLLSLGVVLVLSRRRGGH
jgi:hypothetical protein